MKFRDPKKESDLFSMIEHQQSVLKTVKGVNKPDEVIDWELFREELESILGYDHRGSKRGGRPPFDAVLMLKVLVFQKYYGLSGEETEFQIMDRFSFLQFFGLRTGDHVPDARTIRDFEQLLEKDGRDGTRRLFARFGELLRSESLPAKEGGIVDAGFVAAPGSATAASRTPKSSGANVPKASKRTRRKGGRRIATRAGRRRTARLTTATKTTPKWTRRASWSTAMPLRPEKAAQSGPEAGIGLPKAE